MLKITKALATLAIAASLTAAPAAAQRVLDIESSEPWTHPHSGIVVPTGLLGLERASAKEFAPDFLNLGFSFQNEEEELSLYIYRDTNGGVPVWFEQARLGIELRDIYGKPKLAYAVEAYAWPGAEVWQGQRGIYATPKSTFAKSTGLVLFSVNGWFVKLRASSATKSAEELGAWIDAAFAEITPPSSEVSQPAVVAVTDCTKKLDFKKKAKDAKLDGSSSIISALLGGMIAEKVQEAKENPQSKEAVAWCRDSALGEVQVAYRANASENSYLIALGDSGMGVSVGPDSTGQIFADEDDKKDIPFGITVITDSQRINYVPQNRLPSLKRVLEVINNNRRTSAVSTWGDDSTIEINPASL